MKLSDAIRKGCEGTYQYFGAGFDGKNGYCAWGAAFHGDNSVKGGDWHYKVDSKCFLCDWNSGKLPQHSTIGYIIFHLNDDHRMSREAIAEWVETVEKKIESENAKKEEKTEIELSPVVNGECVLKG